VGKEDEGGRKRKEGSSVFMDIFPHESTRAQSPNLIHPDSEGCPTYAHLLLPLLFFSAALARSVWARGLNSPLGPRAARGLLEWSSPGRLSDDPVWPGGPSGRIASTRPASGRPRANDSTSGVSLRRATPRITASQPPAQRPSIEPAYVHTTSSQLRTHDASQQYQL